MPGNQLAVPAEDRIGREERTDLAQPFSTEQFSFDRQEAPLIVTEPKTSIPLGVTAQAIFGQ